MGDQKITGKGMTLSARRSVDIVINQYRGMADAGGKMTQQRTSTTCAPSRCPA
jgi:hypothetical protein